MNIEAGKYYFDRKDILKGPMSSSTDEDYPWTDGSETWSTRGAFSQSPTEFDLIAEAFVSREPPKEVTAPAEHMTIRQSFVMEAMGKLAAKFTEYERTDSGTRVCPENFETRSKEVAKIACLYADAALAEEARTRSKA